MIKVKVIQSFNDIHTGENHPIGEVFEVTEERLSEIKRAYPSLVKILPDKKKGDK